MRAWPAFRITLQLAAVTTGILLLVGVPLAWLLARREFFGKRLLEAVILLPLAPSSTVNPFTMRRIVSGTGHLNR